MLSLVTSCLFKAAQRGSFALVRALLSHPSCDLLARDEEGNTALHIAASSGHHDIVQELASRYTTPSTGKNKEGHTPLHLACSKGWTKCVNILATIFPHELQMQDNHGNLPVNLAHLHKHHRVVALLHQMHAKGSKYIKQKLATNSTSVAVLNLITSCLFRSIKSGSLVLVRGLLSHPSCDLLARDEEGNTALHIAASSGHHDIVQELASRYTTPSAGKNKEGHTPLHLACSKGWMKCMNILATMFPRELKMKDNDGNLPVNLACLCKHDQVVALLHHIDAKRGKYIRQKPPTNSGSVPVLTSCLFKAVQTGSLALVMTLLSHPSCDLLARDEEGNTALHIAASSGHHDIVQELASRYTTPSAGKNKEGHTPLHLACSKGWATCVTVLADRFPGDLMQKDEHGNLPLHLAALFGHDDIIVCLCDRFGGDPESPGCEGNNCLLLACRGGHVQLVRTLLVKYNCRKDTVDDFGSLPSHCAAFYGHAELLKMLIDEFDYSPTATRPNDGCNVLHHACAGAHVRTANILINKYQVDTNARDSQGCTALHWAYKQGTFPKSCLDGIGDFHFSGDIESCLIMEMLINAKCDPMAKDNREGIALHYAATSGQDQVVKLLVTRYKCPVNCRTEDGDTPLHCAARNGHTNVVQVLLSELGADIQARNKMNDSAINEAAQNGHSNVVTLLVEFGCSPNTKDFNSLLHQACWNGHLDLVEKLIDDYHCDPMARDDEGLTPLHWAALGGKIQVVKKLVAKCKCPVGCTDNKGNTPLHCAARNGHTGVVQILLSELGADIQAHNKVNNSAINEAAWNGHSNVVLLLVEQFGCSPHTKGFNNRTPLHQACWSGNVELVEKLIDNYHCDPMARDDKRLTPLHWAALGGKRQVVRQLLTKYKCPVGCIDNNGDTPLHCAAMEGHKNVVQILLSELGADIQARNKVNNSAINVAAMKGHSNVVTCLVEKFGCSPHTKGFSNRIPLHQACGGGHLELVEKLIDDYHCDPMTRDDEGLTPLHLAALGNRKHVMRKLMLKYKSIPDMYDKDGNTLVHMAVSSGDKDLLELLIDVIGCFPSVKNYQGKLPIDFEPIELLFSPPEVQSCVSYVSKCAVGEHRQTPQKVLVFDSSIALAISKFSLYSLFPLDYAQSCGLCYVNSALSDIYLCQIKSKTSLNSTLLQRVMSGPLLTAICTVNMDIPTDQAMSRVCSQISQVQEVAYYIDSIKLPSQILLLGISSCDKENHFSAFCANIVRTFGKGLSRFSKHFLACDCKTFPEKAFPLITKFLIEAVSTIPNPDVPEITHGSIYLLKFLFRECDKRLYIKFSQLAELLKNRHIMSEGHPEEILACLRQLDSQGYLLTTRTLDYQNMYIVLNPLHVFAELDKLSHTVSDPLNVMGIFPQRVISSAFPDGDILHMLGRLDLSLELPDPVTNIFLKSDLSPHVSDRMFFIPHLASSLRQEKCWISQPEKIFSCGLCLKAIGKQSHFPSQFTSSLLLRVMNLFASLLNQSHGPADCALWKGGIHWMVGGVEVVVEVVDDGRCVAVLGRSDVCCRLMCVDVMVKVVDVVLGVKDVCCCGVVHKVYVLDTDVLKLRTIPIATDVPCYDATKVTTALRTGAKDVSATILTTKMKWLQRFSLQGLPNKFT